MISYLLRFSVLLLVLAPFVEYRSSLNFAGMIPPAAPLVKDVGVFSQPGIGRNAPIVFGADTGAKYYTWPAVAPYVLNGLVVLRAAVKVYVEGFVLNDGHGSFYHSTGEVA